MVLYNYHVTLSSTSARSKHTIYVINLAQVRKITKIFSKESFTAILVFQHIFLAQLKMYLHVNEK